MSQKTTSKKKVDDLKEKVRREQDREAPGSGGDIQSVLYGAHQDNQRASGGEFES